MHTPLVICELCGRHFKYINNTHLKQHGLTIQEYKLKFPHSKIWNDELRTTLNTAHKGKTYETIMGPEKAEEVKRLRRNNAIKQMRDPEQIKVRKEKCGAAEHYTEVRKRNMSKAITAEVIKKRRDTLIANYGSYNECMRKSFVGGRSSKSAKKYIEQFLIDQSINPSRCFYYGGGRTDNEYYQLIDFNGKKKFVMYDLVVFKNLDFQEIDLILEYNGPYHYTAAEVNINPDGKSVHFLDKCETIKESYDKDIAKLNHALTLTNNVYIYWQKQKQLIKYEGVPY